MVIPEVFITIQIYLIIFSNLVLWPYSAIRWSESYREKIEVNNFKWQGVEMVPNIKITIGNFFQNF